MNGRAAILLCAACAVACPSGRFSRRRRPSAPLSYDVSRLLEVHRRHAPVERRPVAGVFADVAGRGWRADPAESQERIRNSGSRAARRRRSRPTASSCSSRSCRPSEAEERARRRRRRGAAPARRLPAAERRRGGRGARGGGAGNARNSLGIMTLADGQVTTIERVARIACRRIVHVARVSARPRGRRRRRAGGGGGGGRGGGGGGGRRRRRRAGGGRRRLRRAAAQTRRPAGQGAGGRRGAARSGERTRGTDLILRNLTTGQETTITEVTDFAWNKTGVWLIYAVSSTDADQGRRVRAQHERRHGRHAADRHAATIERSRSTRTASRSRSSATRPSTTRPVSPYRLYYWKAGDAAATELVSAATRGVPAGMVVSENSAPRFSEDGSAALLTGRRHRRPAAGRSGGATPAPIARRPLELQGSADPADAAGPRDAGAQPQLPRGRAPVATSASCSSRRPICRP